MLIKKSQQIVRDDFHDLGISPYSFEWIHGDDDQTIFSYKGKELFTYFEWQPLFEYHNADPGTAAGLLEPNVRRSDATLLVYDVTNIASFEAVKILHRIAREVTDPEPTRGGPCVERGPVIDSKKKLIIIMANKCDLPEKDWAVDRAEAQEFCARDNATWFKEVSAKTGFNLDKETILTQITDQIYLARASPDSVEGDKPVSLGIRASIMSRLRRLVSRKKQQPDV